MGRETNIYLIQALEKQIEEGKGDVIELKRHRNSLLNISTRVPPEILGYIFAWNLVREDSWYFGGLRKGCCNFLLVCHHWFEVASRTLELWNFWGNTFQDWKKHHHRSGAAPLELVLDEYRCDPDISFDRPLQDAVRSCVMQDTIRRVHLTSNGGEALPSIILSLTPDEEGGQNENIESIVWQNEWFPIVDVSGFFARSRLLGLRLLELWGNFRVSSWDHLGSRTTLLTTLSLDITPSPPPPPTLTAARLFSILTSNPNLQDLTLSGLALPNDANRSTFRAQLRDLKTLSLMGEFHHVFGLLRCLILPETLDEMYLNISNPTVEDISQILGPYMRNYFRRDSRFRGRLGVYSFSPPSSVSVLVGIASTQTTAPIRELPRVSLVVQASQPPNVLEQLLNNLIALVPLEHVRSYNAGPRAKPSEELFFMMPNIETLCISGVELCEGFLQPNPGGPHANMKLLPSLRLLHLEDVPFLHDNDWDHLKTYLTHQTSDNQTISLEMVGNLAYMRQEVADGIKGLVERFAYASIFGGGRTSGGVLVPDITYFN